MIKTAGMYLFKTGALRRRLIKQVPTAGISLYKIAPLKSNQYRKHRLPHRQQMHGACQLPERVRLHKHPKHRQPVSPAQAFRKTRLWTACPMSSVKGKLPPGKLKNRAGICPFRSA